MAVEAGSLAEAQADAAVRRPWCVWLAVGLVLLGLVFNAFYLFHNCPLDLSGDEAHYWEWSRHLDYGYYSKPPGIAWVIAAAIRIGDALRITGDGSGTALMPVMRMAAVIFGTCSGLLSLLLARRLFRDDRAALTVILLSAAVPMFAVGSLLITIDSPMYLCWTATVYCLWRAIEKSEDRNPKTKTTAHSPGNAGWLYAAGLACAIGMLFKPVLIAIPICAAIAGRANPAIRRAIKSKHAMGALALVVLSQVPVVVWNAFHHWVMFLHIGTQGGFAGGSSDGSAVPQSLVAKYLMGPIGRMGFYLGGQAGGMGGLMFLLLVIAIVMVLRQLRAASRSRQAKVLGAPRTAWVFLLSFSLPLWGFYFVMNLWKDTEINWPAASYCAGMILLAGVVTYYWNLPPGRPRRDWRGWTSAAFVCGMILTALAMNLQRFYPLMQEKLQPLAGTPQYAKSWWNPRRWDPSAGKLRGLLYRAQTVEEVRKALAAETGQEPLIIANRYDVSSALSFYLPGHPFVYCIMSATGGRHNQYDLWPGLDQRENGAADGRPVFAGRPAIMVGDIAPDMVNKILRNAFERVDPPRIIPVIVDGVTIRETAVYRMYGFRELPESKGTVY